VWFSGFRVASMTVPSTSLSRFSGTIWQRMAEQSELELRLATLKSGGHGGNGWCRRWNE